MSPDIVQKVEQFQNFSIKKCNAHYLDAETYKRRNLKLGVTVTILMAVVVTSIFGTLSQNDKIVWLVIATGTISVLASILSALQTFLKFSETAQ